MTQETGSPNQNSPPVDRLAQLWKRVHDHKIVQWSVAYIAIAYAFQHGIVLTGEAFEWPEAVLRVSMLLMIIGLPLVITLAWYHGERASRHFSTAELTIISLLLVIGSGFFYTAVQPHQEVASNQTQALQQPKEPDARATANSPATAISVAVLPFANMSGDASQEFFSDGITEEITNALAQVPDLRVVARTSAFQFKGQNGDIKAIGQQLRATHLIEGSVRKVGNRVRITTQLIRADDGVHVWAQNYDRDLDDIFAIQEDIAQAVAASFRMPVVPGENLARSRTRNQEAYEEYLRARSLVRARNFASITEAVKLLERAVALDPEFASAWGFLGTAYRLIPRFDPVRQSGAIERAKITVDASMSKAEAAAQRAIKLDPKNANGYEALGDVQRTRNKYDLAVEFYTRALELEPENPELLNTYSITLAELGYLKQALPIRERLRGLEPYVPVFNSNYAQMLWASGQADAAAEILKSVPGGGGPALRMRTNAAQGRYAEAASILETISTNDAEFMKQVSAAAKLLRGAPTFTGTPQELPRLGLLGEVYLYVGLPDRVMEYHEGNIKIGYHGGMELVPLWAQSFTPVRKTARFKAYVRNAGMVDYWRVKGWPEFCRPTTGDDFVCD